MVSFLLLPEGDAPERAENDDAGHVNRPAGEFVLAHLRLAHGVEEKLQVPGDSGQGAEEIVAQHRDALSPVLTRLARMPAAFTFRRVRRCPGVRLGSRLRCGPAQPAAEILVTRPVLEEKKEAPEEIA